MDGLTRVQISQVQDPFEGVVGGGGGGGCDRTRRADVGLVEAGSGGAMLALAGPGSDVILVGAPWLPAGFSLLGRM